MAKVRVRALQRGFDGQVRREPGDEFDYDIDLSGQGAWFERITEAEVLEHRPDQPVAAKKRSKKTSKKRSRKSADDLLA